MDNMHTKFQVRMSNGKGNNGGRQVWLILLSRQSCDTKLFKLWFASKVIKTGLIGIPMDNMHTKFQVCMSNRKGNNGGRQVWLILLSRQSCDTKLFNLWFASKVIKTGLIGIPMDNMHTKFQVCMSNRKGNNGGRQVWLILLSRQSFNTKLFNH